MNNKKFFFKRVKYFIYDIKHKCYDLDVFNTSIYCFNSIDEIKDFMKKNGFSNWFVVGGSDDSKIYCGFIKYKKTFKNFIIGLTNKRR